MNYFTADIHFWSEKTMRCDHRPFKSIRQYNRFTIKEFNKKAKSGDVIYVVGDLLDCGTQDATNWIKGLKLIKKIKADIVLILGNNELRVIRNYFNNNFDNFVNCCKAYGIKEVYDNLDIEFAGKKFHLVHQIKDGKKNKINLFGHTHLCSGIYHPYGLCVSCDLNHFRLFTEKIILRYLERKRDYWEPDDNLNYVNPFLKEENGKVVNIKQKNNKIFKKYLQSY